MDYVKELVKKYGGSSFVTGDQLLNKKMNMIPFSPKLDIILGGGIPGGSFVILSGDPKCGKTVSALHFAGNAQKLDRNVHILNIEGRLKSRDLKGIKNLDAGKVKVWGSYKDKEGGKIYTAEEWLDIAETLINEDHRSIIILDSTSQLATEKEFTSDIQDQHRAPVAQLMSRFIKRISNIMQLNDCVLIDIVHLIANTSGIGKRKVKSGGRKIQYAVDVDLEATRVVPWKIGKNDDSDQIGQKVTWKTNSTSILPPGKTTDSCIRYGIGIDEVYELIDIGISYGLIEQAGAWFTIKGVKDKIHGQEKVYKLLQEDEGILKDLQSKINDMVGIKKEEE